MTDRPKAGLTELVDLTADVVGAYVSNNALNASDLPKLIAEVYGALAALAAPTIEQVEIEPAKPAVAIRKSITPDFLICLEDGKKLKTLKRHLANVGMTPAEYRAKWRLPADYPMVAPNYAATRSQLARDNGLGRKAAEPIASPAPVRGGRKTNVA